MSGFILEIGQSGSNGPPSVTFGGPFLRNGVQERGSPKGYLSLLVQTVIEIIIYRLASTEHEVKMNLML